MLVYIPKLFNYIIYIFTIIISTFLVKFLFIIYGIKYGKGFISRGTPLIRIPNKGKIVIGNNLTINNGEKYNPIGRQSRCIFVISGLLEIKNNVGMSSTTIVCRSKIKIGNNVMIGGNVCIYDTDFHSINAKIRNDRYNDQKLTINLPITIMDNVFIGAHTTILKNTTIGENSIIGACSVVSKDIPANEIWAGNPARFIKKIKGHD